MSVKYIIFDCKYITESSKFHMYDNIGKYVQLLQRYAHHV